MQAGSLSVDEFASLVAAALQEELNVGGGHANRGVRIGGNNRLTDVSLEYLNNPEAMPYLFGICLSSFSFFFVSSPLH